YLVSERRKEEGQDNSEHKSSFVIKKTGTEIIWLIFLLFIAYLFAYRYNIRPWHTFQGVIHGYQQVSAGKIESGVETYKASFTGFALDQDGRKTLVNLVASNPSLLDSLPQAKAQEILDYVISLAQLNVQDNQYDSLTQMQLAQTYDVAARFNYKNPALFNYYSGQALQTIEYSIEASPRRIPVYLVKAQIQLERSENEDAVNTVKYAISLNPTYADPYCRLAQFYIFLQDEIDLGDALNKCVDLGGVSEINSDKILSMALNYYAARADYPHALVLAERLASIYNRDPQVLFNLAKLYLISGDRVKAQATVDSAVAIDPKLAADGEKLMKIKVPEIKK
ncbi:MAG: tetratricopeptide repeat protein, partial [Patescibacteria group bacterium]